ncbi:MAG: TIGR04255 family protein [Pseudomonadales bacterium]|nr:TIGR04255 family protein [Pseudomonadales bacterium]MCP5187654.1 TIGR04255 family protein [Pseudomonadales bacterium]
MTYESLGHLPRAPLVFSLAMIEFAPVPGMAEYAPAILEEVRQNYPDSLDYTVNSMKVSVRGGAGGFSMENEEVPQWRAGNAEGDFGFVFGRDRVVFHTTSYKHFDDFAEKIHPILETISRIAKIDHSRSIGIRHIDNIHAIDGLDYSQILKPGYLCPPQNGGLSPLQSRVEFIYRSELGQLFARCYELQDHPRVPQDLFQLAEQLPRSGLMEQVSVRFVMADTDHIYAPRALEKFNLDRVLNLLDRLHKQNSLGFRAMVTEEAIAAWKKE